MNKFEIGKTYATRSICDHDCIFRFTIKARSAKFVTLNWNGDRRDRRVGLFIENGVEHCLPLGRYSMAPVLDAGDLA